VYQRDKSGIAKDKEGDMEITLKNQGFFPVLYLYVREAYN
jgi:hypothetical protein